MAATQFPEIRKTAADLAVHSHLADYESVRRLFSWDAMRRELGVVAGGFVNIAYAAVDRHLATPVGDRVALRFVARNAAPRDVTYVELARRTNRFANVLRTLGVGRGDRVFVLAGRSPEFYIAVLGALKNGSVVIPCSSGFGMESVRARLAASEAGVLVTTEALYRTGVDGIASELRHLAHTLVAGENGTHTRLRGTVDLATRMERAADTFDAVRTGAEDVALLQFAGDEATPGPRSTFTAPPSRTTPAASTRSICTTTTSSGARSIPPRRQACRPASSRRSCMGSAASSTRRRSTPRVHTASSPTNA